MNYPFSRRRFIKTTAAGSIGLVSALHGMENLVVDTPPAPGELYTVSNRLVSLWGQSLLKLQVTDAARTDEYGGIMCPGYHLVHGRVGDTIYPFLHLAHKTNDVRYADGAVQLYRWMERRVSQEDGSWLNEPVKGSWKGTTIFTIIALCDTLRYHGVLLDEPFKQELRTRLQKAGDYVYNTFNIDYGNINYPISAAYGLTLLGELLQVPRFATKGRELAYQALAFITKKDGLLFGEGDPYYQASPKGCYSVDLGYNVEESLPSLAMYGLFTKDEAILQAVTRSLQTHMEFMLPDGGWDNSWGTRNYKWTYWGSRTSDGCQPAYALLAGRDPRFYTVALKNAQLLEQCTHDGLLYGGPHYVSHKVPVSVHHTFCHIKALTTILDHERVQPAETNNKIILPRSANYDTRFFADIQTWLISTGKYRATVTGYDREYKKTTNGHATGALTMLWHEATGPLITASMNEYQLYEAGNMQPDNDPLSMCLTPRLEWRSGSTLYMNISDLSSTIQVKTGGGVTHASIQSRLVDKNQQPPPGGIINCRIEYAFSPNKITCSFHYTGNVPEGTVRVVFPVISATGEKITASNSKVLSVHKPDATVKLSSNKDILQLPTTTGRVFNFVPGVEAIPLAMEGRDVTVEIQVMG